MPGFASAVQRLDCAPMELHLADLAATGALAARLAATARPGDCILLEGPLGTGKSAFARAFLRALAGDAGLEVPSPTFTLVQAYDMPGGMTAWHYDLYRLDGPEGLLELAWEEARDGLVLVEWPERLGRFAPAGALRLTLEPLDGDARRATLAGWAGRAW